MLGHSRNSDFWAPGSPGGELVSIIYSHCGRCPILFPWEIGSLFNFEERELRIIIGMVANFKQCRFKWTLSVFLSLFATLQSAYLNAGEGVKLLFEFRFFPLTTRREVEAQVTEEMQEAVVGRSDGSPTSLEHRLGPICSKLSCLWTLKRISQLPVVF